MLLYLCGKPADSFVVQAPTAPPESLVSVTIRVPTDRRNGSKS